MAKIKSKTNIEVSVKINLELTYDEAKALSQITVYGHSKFLEWFYRNLGKAYLKPHERGLISLFETIRGNVEFELNRIDEICNKINNIRNDNSN